jgi:hypothetical protein
LNVEKYFFYNRIKKLKDIAKNTEQDMDLFQAVLDDGWWVAVEAVFIGSCY